MYQMYILFFKSSLNKFFLFQLNKLNAVMSGSVKIGLEAIGLQNNQHLKNSLINCDDPLKAISDFQEENSIQLPTLKPALNLLDLHKIKRLDFHLSIGL